MQTAVVTGTDHGLGRALLDELARRGFRVFAGSHVLAKRGEGARDISEAVTELPLDVTDPHLVHEFGRNVEARSPSLDLLVNNAGVNPEKGVRLEDLDFDVVKRVFDVNSLGPLPMTQALVSLLARGANKTIVNVSSEAGSLTTCGRTSWFGYSMSKAALNMQTRLLENYLAPSGFRVFSVHPGWMRTPMANFEGPIAPEDAAARIVRLILDTKPEVRGFLNADGTSHPW